MGPERIAIILVASGLLLTAIAATAKLWMPARWKQRLRARKESGEVSWVLTIAVPLGYLAFTGALVIPFGGSLYLRVLHQLPMALMFASMQFWAKAWRRVGDQIRCSKCKYELAGLAPGLPRGTSGEHDAKCPECGGQWGLEGGSEKLRRVLDRRRLWVGIALLVPLVAEFASRPIMGMQWWDEKLLKLTPTPCLVEEVLTQKGFTIAAWAELRTRSETPAQIDRIQRTLLGKPAGAYFNGDETAWLEAKIAARAIDAKLLERRFSDWLTVKAEPSGMSNSVMVRIGNGMLTPGPFKTIAVDAVVVPTGMGKWCAPQVNVFATYGPIPLCQLESTTEPRFRGTLTIVLMPAAAPIGFGMKLLDVDEAGKVTPLSEPLYRFDLPMDSQRKTPPARAGGGG